MFQVDFWSEVKRWKCVFSCSHVSEKQLFCQALQIIMNSSKSRLWAWVVYFKKSWNKGGRNEWERNVLCCFGFYFIARNCCLFTFSSPEKRGCAQWLNLSSQGNVHCYCSSRGGGSPSPNQSQPVIKPFLGIKNSVSTSSFIAILEQGEGKKINEVTKTEW